MGVFGEARWPEFPHLTPARIDADPRMRFRVWIAGELVDEAWVDTGNPDFEEHAEAVRDRHHVTAARAAERDLPWLLEWWDPDTDTYGRFGTDADAMVDPRPMTGEAVQEWLRKYNA